MAAIAALAVSAIGAGLSGFMGASQLSQAKKLAKDNERPTKPISQAYLDQLAGARTQAGKYGFAGMAQQQRQLDRATAQSMRNLQQSSVSPLATIQGLSNVDYNTKMAQEKMAQTAEEAKKSALGTYYNALGIMGQQQDEAWKYNYQDKYEENAAAISALNESAMSNFNTAFNTLGQGVVGFADAGGFSRSTNRTTDTNSNGGPSDSSINVPENIFTAPKPNYAMNRSSQPSQAEIDRMNQIYDMSRMTDMYRGIYGKGISDNDIYGFINRRGV